MPKIETEKEKERRMRNMRIVRRAKLFKQDGNTDNRICNLLAEEFNMTARYINALLKREGAI